MPGFGEKKTLPLPAAFFLGGVFRCFSSLSKGKIEVDFWRSQLESCSFLPSWSRHCGRIALEKEYNDYSYQHLGSKPLQLGKRKS